jgi:hypothetical protein
MDVTHNAASADLYDSCFQILTETAELLTHIGEVVRGLAQGCDTLTPEKAADIASVIETARLAAAARIVEYKRLHESPTPARLM